MSATAEKPNMTLRWGGKGASGPRQETPDEKAKWAQLVAFMAEQGDAYEHPIRVVFKVLKTPMDVYRWNPETQKRELKYPNAKGTQGCGLLFEATELGLEGIAFWTDGAASLFPTTPLAKTIAAIAKRKFSDDEAVNPFDYVGRELVLDIAMGKAVTPREDMGHLAKGGRYWKIRGFKPVRAVATFGQSAVPAPAPQAPPPVSVHTATADTFLDDNDDDLAPF